MADMKLVKQFAETLKEANKRTEPYDTPAEVVRIEDGTAWVHIPGGVDETPVQLTVNAEEGDTVQVRVGGGSAWITGNATAPPTDDKTANAAKQTATEAQEAAVEASDTATRAARNADSAIKIAGNTAQHFWFTETGSDTGAHITEVTEEEFLNDPANGGGNLLARSNGIAIRDGLTELASFGETVRLGEDNKSHAEFDYHSFKLTDRNGNDYFYASDLRDTTGYAEIVDTFVGDGTTTAFTISLSPSTTPEVTVDGTVVSNFSHFNRTITFDTAPATGAEISATYKTNSTLAKAFTLGTRRDNIGASSVVEGSNCTASGFVSHAEGAYTQATSGYTHAEGHSCKATQSCAHAEGSSSVASGSDAHAEGQHTTASGDHSHAEGYYTAANATYSHSQNNRTIANRRSQTAMGEYNVADTSGTIGGRGLYAVIVGNGTSDSARSNAFTVDWNGNVEATGDVTDGSGNVLSSKADASAIPTALSQLSEDASHRTVTDTEKTAWNNKVDATSDFFIIKEYTYAYSNLNPGAGLNITATNFGFSRPTGYVPIAFLRTNSGSVNVSVIGANAQATGSGAALSIYNHSTAARSYTATITVLYARSSMVTTA